MNGEPSLLGFLVYAAALGGPFALLLYFAVRGCA